MGILITATEEKPIQISGTELTLETVYARIVFRANADGVSLEIAYQIYTNNAMWVEGNIISTDIPQTNFNVSINPATQEQSITVALEYAKVGFEQLGYTAAVVA